MIGTMGEAPARIHPVNGLDDVHDIRVRDERLVVWLSQTTLSVDETTATVTKLKERFPALALGRSTRPGCGV